MSHRKDTDYLSVSARVRAMENRLLTRDRMDRMIDAALPRELTLDLGGLTFTDSSGIAVLLRAHRRMGQVRGAMRVINTPGQAEKVFRAAGLQRIIRFE